MSFTSRRGSFNMILYIIDRDTIQYIYTYLLQQVPRGYFDHIIYNIANIKNTPISINFLSYYCVHIRAYIIYIMYFQCDVLFSFLIISRIIVRVGERLANIISPMQEERQRNYCQLSCSIINNYLTKLNKWTVWPKTKTLS